MSFRAQARMTLRSDPCSLFSSTSFVFLFLMMPVAPPSFLCLSLVLPPRLLASHDLLVFDYLVLPLCSSFTMCRNVTCCLLSACCQVCASPGSHSNPNAQLSQRRLILRQLQISMDFANAQWAQHAMPLQTRFLKN